MGFYFSEPSLFEKELHYKEPSSSQAFLYLQWSSYANFLNVLHCFFPGEQWILRPWSLLVEINATFFWRNTILGVRNEHLIPALNVSDASLFLFYTSFCFVVYISHQRQQAWFSVAGVTVLAMKKCKYSNKWFRFSANCNYSGQIAQQQFRTLPVSSSFLRVHGTYTSAPLHEIRFYYGALEGRLILMLVLPIRRSGLVLLSGKWFSLSGAERVDFWFVLSEMTLESVID